MISRIKRLIIAEPVTLRAILATCALLLSVGFVTGEATNNNYMLIQAFMSFHSWSAVLFLYGITKAYQLFYNTNCWFRATSSLVGMWVWSYIFLSFTLFDPTPMLPTEILLLIPVLMEVWSFAGTLYTYNYIRDKKKKG